MYEGSSRMAAPTITPSRSMQKLTLADSITHEHASAIRQEQEYLATTFCFYSSQTASESNEQIFGERVMDIAPSVVVSTPLHEPQPWLEQRTIGDGILVTPSSVVKKISVSSVRDANLQTDASMSIELVLARSMEIQNSFMQYVTSLQKENVAQSQGQQQVGIDQLEHLSRLVTQLAKIRAKNLRLMRKIEYLADMKKLHKMYTDYLVSTCRCRSLPLGAKAIPELAVTAPSMQSLPCSGGSQPHLPHNSLSADSVKSEPAKKKKRSLKRKVYRSKSLTSLEMVPQNKQSKPSSYWERVKEAFTRRDKDVIDRFIQDPDYKRELISTRQEEPLLSPPQDRSSDRSSSGASPVYKSPHASVDSEPISAADLIDISSNSDDSDYAVFRQESLKSHSSCRFPKNSSSKYLPGSYSEMDDADHLPVPKQQTEQSFDDSEATSQLLRPSPLSKTQNGVPLKSTEKADRRSLGKAAKGYFRGVVQSGKDVISKRGKKSSSQDDSISSTPTHPSRASSSDLLAGDYCEWESRHQTPKAKLVERERDRRQTASDSSHDLLVQHRHLDPEKRSPVAERKSWPEQSASPTPSAGPPSKNIKDKLMTVMATAKKDVSSSAPCSPPPDQMNFPDAPDFDKLLSSEVACTSSSATAPTTTVPMHMTATQTEKDKITLQMLKGLQNQDFAKRMIEWEKKKGGEAASLPPNIAKPRKPPKRTESEKSAVSKEIAEALDLEHSHSEGSLLEGEEPLEDRKHDADKISRKGSKRMERKSSKRSRLVSKESQDREKQEKEKNKLEKMREKKLMKVTREQQKLDKEKQRLEKERLKTLEKEARLDFKKELWESEPSKAAHHKLKKDITVETQKGEHHHFEKISGDYLKKLRKWDERKKVPAESSTLALLNKRRSMTRTGSRIRTESESSSSSRDLLSDKVPSRDSESLQKQEKAAVTEPSFPKASYPQGKDGLLFQESLPITPRASTSSDKQPSPDIPISQIAPPVYFYDGNELSDDLIASAFEPIQPDLLWDVGMASSFYSKHDNLEEKNLALLEEVKEKTEENEQLKKQSVELQSQLKSDKERDKEKMDILRGVKLRRVMADNVALERTMSDVRTEIERLQLYGRRLTLEKGILQTSVLQQAERQEGERKRLLEEIQALRRNNLKLLSQQLTNDGKLNSEFEDMLKSSSDVEKVYSYTLHLQAKCLDLKLALLERNRFIGDMEWQLLEHEANSLLLQAEINRLALQLNYHQRAHQLGLLRRCHTFHGLDFILRKEKDSELKAVARSHSYKRFMHLVQHPHTGKITKYFDAAQYEFEHGVFGSAEIEAELDLEDILRLYASKEDLRDKDEQLQRHRSESTPPQPCISETSKRRQHLRRWSTTEASLDPSEGDRDVLDDKVLESLAEATQYSALEKARAVFSKVPVSPKPCTLPINNETKQAVAVTSKAPLKASHSVPVLSSLRKFDPVKEETSSSATHSTVRKIGLPPTLVRTAMPSSQDIPSKTVEKNVSKEETRQDVCLFESDVQQNLLNRVAVETKTVAMPESHRWAAGDKMVPPEASLLTVDWEKVATLERSVAKKLSSATQQVISTPEDDNLQLTSLEKGDALLPTKIQYLREEKKRVGTSATGSTSSLEEVIDYVKGLIESEKREVVSDSALDYQEELEFLRCNSDSQYESPMHRKKSREEKDKKATDRVLPGETETDDLKTKLRKTVTLPATQPRNVLSSQFSLPSRETEPLSPTSHLSAHSQQVLQAKADYLASPIPSPDYSKLKFSFDFETPPSAATQHGFDYSKTLKEMGPEVRSMMQPSLLPVVRAASHDPLQMPAPKMETRAASHDLLLSVPSAEGESSIKVDHSPRDEDKKSKKKKKKRRDSKELLYEQMKARSSKDLGRPEHMSPQREKKKPTSPTRRPRSAVDCWHPKTEGSDSSGNGVYCTPKMSRKEGEEIATATDKEIKTLSPKTKVKDVVHGKKSASKDRSLDRKSKDSISEGKMKKSKHRSGEKDVKLPVEGGTAFALTSVPAKSKNKSSEDETDKNEATSSAKDKSSSSATTLVTTKQGRRDSKIMQLAHVLMRRSSESSGTDTKKSQGSPTIKVRDWTNRGQVGKLTSAFSTGQLPKSPQKKRSHVSSGSYYLASSYSSSPTVEHSPGYPAKKAQGSSRRQVISSSESEFSGATDGSTGGSPVVQRKTPPSKSPKYFSKTAPKESPCCGELSHSSKSPLAHRNRLSGFFCQQTEISSEDSPSDYEDASEDPVTPTGEMPYATHLQSSGSVLPPPGTYITCQGGVKMQGPSNEENVFQFPSKRVSPFHSSGEHCAPHPGTYLHSTEDIAYISHPTTSRSVSPSARRIHEVRQQPPGGLRERNLGFYTPPIMRVPPSGRNGSHLPSEGDMTASWHGETASTGELYLKSKSVLNSPESKHDSWLQKIFNR